MFDLRNDVSGAVVTYTTPSRFSSKHCKAIATQLQQAAPADLRDIEREALRMVMTRALEVHAIATARERSAPPSVRGPRNALVASWGAIHGALQQVATIPIDVSPDGAIASRIALSLFPDGMQFGLGDAPAVWEHSDRLRGRIASEGLDAQLRALIHPALLETLHRAHALLSEVTGLGTGPAPDASSASLRTARSRFAYSVSAYARALSIGLDDQDHDGAERFVRAMSPIDPFRITNDKNDDEDDDVVSDPIAPRPGDPTPPPFG
ncbi:MAG: hypothetical protein J0L92_10740 [Deltaproteobacteria bacterium]|nr:hypothetical protein [Deltaproteobacteria bacterium]